MSNSIYSKVRLCRNLSEAPFQTSAFQLNLPFLSQISIVYLLFYFIYLVAADIVIMRTGVP